MHAETHWQLYRSVDTQLSWSNQLFQYRVNSVTKPYLDISVTAGTCRLVITEIVRILFNEMRIQPKTHWSHDVVAALNQRQCRWFNVATTSCAQWEMTLPKVRPASIAGWTCLHYLASVKVIRIRYSVWNKTNPEETQDVFLLLQPILMEFSGHIHQDGVYHNIHQVVLSNANNGKPIITYITFTIHSPFSLSPHTTRHKEQYRY